MVLLRSLLILHACNHQFVNQVRVGLKLIKLGDYEISQITLKDEISYFQLFLINGIHIIYLTVVQTGLVN